MKSLHFHSNQHSSQCAIMQLNHFFSESHYQIQTCTIPNWVSIFDILVFYVWIGWNYDKLNDHWSYSNPLPSTYLMFKFALKNICIYVIPNDRDQTAFGLVLLSQQQKPEIWSTTIRLSTSIILKRSSWMNF